MQLCPDLSTAPGGAVGETLPDGAALAVRLQDPRLASPEPGQDLLAAAALAPAGGVGPEVAVGKDLPASEAMAASGLALPRLRPQRQRRRLSSQAAPDARSSLPKFGVHLTVGAVPHRGVL